MRATQDTLAEHDALVNYGWGNQRRNPAKYDSSSAHISGYRLYSNVECHEGERLASPGRAWSATLSRAVLMLHTGH